MFNKIFLSIVIGLTLSLTARAQNLTAPEDAMKRSEEALKAAQADYASSLRELMTTEAEVRQATGRLDVSPDALQKAASRLDELHETLMLEQVGADARRRGIERAMKQEVEIAAKHLEEDAVLTELQKLAQTREVQLKRIQELRKAAAVSEADVDGAVAALAEAKAKLAERQQQSTAGPEAETMASLRRELLNLNINDEERQARTAYVKAQQDHLAEVMGNLPAVQRAIDRLQSARKQLERAQTQLQMLRIYGLAYKNIAPTQPADR